MPCLVSMAVHYGWDGGFIILVGACVASIICLLYAFLGEREIHKQKELEQQKEALTQ